MTALPGPIRLSPVIRTKLRSVRRRWLLLGLSEAVTAACAALLAGMLIAMCADWLFQFHAQGWRLALTVAAVTLAGSVLVCFVSRAIAGRWRLVSSAHLVDRTLPFLQERWSAVTELTASSDPPEIRGSDRLLWQTMLEAESYAHLVTPAAILPARGLGRRLRLLILALVGVLLLVLLAPDVGRLLVRRFWNPLTDITLTRLHGVTGSRVVPRGEPLTLVARMDGRAVQEAEVAIRAAGETRRFAAGRPVEAPDLLSYHLSEVSDPFDYQFTAGDGRTAWYSIVPADRPAIDSVRFCVTPPAYSKLLPDRRDKFPRYCRALEGSRLEIEFTTNHRLAGLHLQRGEGAETLLDAIAERTYRYEAVLTEDVTLLPRLADRNGLTNAPIVPCRIVVDKDQAPSVELLSPDDDMAVSPDEKIEIEFSAQDDVGVAGAELLVHIEPPPGDRQRAGSSRPADETPGDGQPGTTTATAPSDRSGPEGGARDLVMPVPLDRPDARAVRGRAELDLKPYKLVRGQRVSYAVRVSDARAGTAGAEGSVRAERQREESESPSARGSPGGARQADGGAATQPAAAKAQVAQAPGTRRDAERQMQGDTAAPAPSDPGMRVIDVPRSGTSCSATRGLRIDEWAGSYAAQKRHKKQVAIDRHLKRMAKALADAQVPGDEALQHLRGGGRWDRARSVKAADVREHLAEADGAATELKRESAGTPYAFIGLQLDDIVVSHVSPARLHFTDVEAVAAGEHVTLVDKGVYHIARARELLDKLTAQYEQAKREEARKEALVELAKMHRLLVEDMFGLLGSCKPTLNPRDGKWRLVPDELAEQILAMLSKNMDRKKELLAALAKALADDPDLLRRYMAMTRKESQTVRDQLTVLARRQTGQCDLLKTWHESDQAGQAALLAFQKNRLLVEQAELVQLGAQLNDAMVTWAPRDADRSGPLGAAIQQADLAARLMRKVPVLQASGQTSAAMELVRTQILPAIADLQDRLAEVDRAGRTAPAMLRYLVRRLEEASTLISRQQDWVERMQAIEEGRYAHAARIEQAGLQRDTRAFTERFGQIAAGLRAAYDAGVGRRAERLSQILDPQIAKRQQEAVRRLQRQEVPEARVAQEQAVASFAEAERAFDELLTLIEEEIASRPMSAPAPAEEPPPLEERLARLIKALQEEGDACEKLGAVIRSNIAMQGDWMGLEQGDGTGSGTGEGSGTGRASGSGAGQAEPSSSGSGEPESEREKRGQGQSGTAELAAASAKARDAARAAEESLSAVQGGSGERREEPGSGSSGTNRATSVVGNVPDVRDWNVLVSKLGDAMKQGRDTLPPEQYRAAIDAYFREIASQINAGKSAATGRGD